MIPRSWGSPAPVCHGNDRSALFKAPVPESHNQTRDKNSISVSHDHLMGSKRSSIITHIIKFNNPGPGSKLGTDGT